ncbi:hypothetical protein QTP86_030617 [Hemibagrus guttatus]|nr:hypothetical protein QTP86_030617 [Hemibagrus guttatus]
MAVIVNPGLDRSGDEEVMGKFGVKERNLEGQMVVDFAKRMDMGVVNTYFQKREEHRVTYKSGGRRTQVDYILCRRGKLKEISDCKVLVGESVARQHRMVVCRMTLLVCKTKRSKIEIEKKTKWWKLNKEECCEEFRQKLRQALGGQVVLPDDWETTAEVIRETGRKVLGVSSGRRKEDKETWWWNEEVQDSIQRKRLAKKKWDMDRTEENRQEYKELHRRVKREVSKAKQKAYDKLAEGNEPVQGQRIFTTGQICLHFLHKSQQNTLMIAFTCQTLLEAPSQNSSRSAHVPVGASPHQLVSREGRCPISWLTEESSGLDFVVFGNFVFLPALAPLMFPWGRCPTIWFSVENAAPLLGNGGEFWPGVFGFCGFWKFFCRPAPLRSGFGEGRCFASWIFVNDVTSLLVRWRRVPAVSGSRPPALWGVPGTSETKIFTRCGRSSVDVARRECSAVDVARRCDSAVDVARPCGSAVDVARLCCSTVDAPSRLRLLQPVFCHPKKEGGLGPILDLWALNCALNTFKFRMLTLKLIALQIRFEDWFVTIDFKDAYFHIGILPEHRKFLRVAFRAKADHYCVLPFGLALSLHTFTKCMDAALVLLHFQGIHVLNYLDNWPILAQSKAMSANH